MIKVVIADDQELIRESLKIVLGTHEDIQVVNIATLSCICFKPNP